MFVQVLDPLNNVLGANEQITFEEGQVLNYSLISKFNYENRSLDICEYITPKDKFQKGRYTVNVFNQNQLVSTSEFTMK